jgi:superfamily II DNA or RNA helicase
VIKKISSFIFPNFGARVRKDDVPGFPECQNIAGLYQIDKTDLQNKKFAEMNRRIAILEAKRTSGTEFAILAERMKYRQITETYKIPLLIDLSKEHVEAGHSVIIFTQFVATLEEIVKKLKTQCYISGGQSPDHRSRALRDFGADKERILVANIQAGGVSIDGMQDLKGEYSRVGLVCPTDDAVLLKQTLGRIHRSNSKSKSMNILVYAAGTVEEKIFKNVNHKIANINILNDGDLAETETFK